VNLKESSRRAAFGVTVNWLSKVNSIIDAALLLRAYGIHYGRSSKANRGRFDSVARAGGQVVASRGLLQTPAHDAMEGLSRGSRGVASTTVMFSREQWLVPRGIVLLKEDPVL
jgi:hypothetical protein